ncbi:CatB-related O-acetyltransferase [Thioclava sediminum]|uniref:CatB-related O-acetyltransferase n=1 Tax=Thioclava sediminum TaxID=1915319 RepID=UPI000996C801|nr:CatB-related O-acetyltransferase [Thioclava sediminum]
MSAHSLPRRFPAPDTRNPVLLPDGTPHEPTVFLQAVIDHPNIEVGRYAYYSPLVPTPDAAAELAPYLYPGCPERLVIGAFAQIAHGVRFITASANHPMGGITTYPFRIFDMETAGKYLDENAAIGDTVIGPDVWLGFNAMVMPGVRIGAGAIVAAGSVVAQDVPPFAIVAGNPARVVRSRFSPDEIARLLDLGWWDWPVEAIQRALPALEAGDVAALAEHAP